MIPFIGGRVAIEDLFAGNVDHSCAQVVGDLGQDFGKIDIDRGGALGIAIAEKRFGHTGRVDDGIGEFLEYGGLDRVSVRQVHLDHLGDPGDLALP